MLGIQRQTNHPEQLVASACCLFWPHLLWLTTSSAPPALAPRCCSTPVGGLTLALSRENSVKGGQQAACPSRERSVRDGSVRSVRSSSGRPPSTSPLERSISAGQRTYHGLQLADNRPTEPHHHLRRLEEAFGCGSAEWMGDPPVARLADMVRGLLWAVLTCAQQGAHGSSGALVYATSCHAAIVHEAAHLLACQPGSLCPSDLPSPQLDSCEHPAAPAAPGAALQDLFAQSTSLGGGSGSHLSSQPATCRPSEAIPEEERQELFDIQPQEVGALTLKGKLWKTAWGRCPVWASGVLQLKQPAACPRQPVVAGM